MLNDSYCNIEDDYSCESPKVKYAEGGRYLKLSFKRSPAMEWNQEQFFRHPDGSQKTRGLCRGFSFRSRRCMLDRLNQVSVASEMPDFVTLTLPDDCFEESVTAFAKTAKVYLDVLLKRISRVCPFATGFWRMEWKARKSGLYEGKFFPHFHLFIWGLPQRLVKVGDVPQVFESFVTVRDCQQSFDEMGKRVLKEHVFWSVPSGDRFVTRLARHQYRVEDADHIAEKFGVEATFMSFFDWVSLAWYHVVGTGNVDHFLAGCRVEKIRTWGGVLSYCAKYMSKAESESFLSEIPVGRAWGIFNREFMPWAKIVELDLSLEVGVRLRRIARRYLEHCLGRRVKRPYGVTLYCNTAQWSRLLARPPDTPF